MQIPSSEILAQLPLSPEDRRWLQDHSTVEGAMAQACDERLEAFASAFVPENYRTYLEATEPAWKAYSEAEKAAYQAYREAVESAYQAYQEVERPAWRALLKAREAAEQAYLKVQKPTYQDYLEAVAKARAQLAQAICQKLSEKFALPIDD